MRPTNPRLPSASDGSRGCCLGAASWVPTYNVRGMIQPLAAVKRLRTFVARAANVRIARDVVVVAERRAMARVERKTWGKWRGPTPSPSRRVDTSSTTVHRIIADVRRNTRGTNTARLWAFANYGGPWRTSGLAFTRQRSLVRTQHRPLQESSVLRQTYGRGRDQGFTPASFTPVLASPPGGQPRWRRWNPWHPFVIERRGEPRPGKPPGTRRGWFLWPALPWPPRRRRQGSMPGRYHLSPRGRRYRRR